MYFFSNEPDQQMVKPGGLGAVGGLGFESGYLQVTIPFIFRGIQSESKPPGPKPFVDRTNGHDLYGPQIRWGNFITQVSRCLRKSWVAMECYCEKLSQWKLRMTWPFWNVPCFLCLFLFFLQGFRCGLAHTLIGPSCFNLISFFFKLRITSGHWRRTLSMEQPPLILRGWP